MSDLNITSGRDANHLMNSAIGASLVETHNALNAVLIAAVVDDDRDRVAYLGHVLQVVSDNIAAIQVALAEYDAGPEDEEQEVPDFAEFLSHLAAMHDEPERVTVEDENGGKHGLLGYTITVQNHGSEHVEHAGLVTDIFSNTTRLFPTIEEARSALASIIFDPNSTVHISEVYTVEDIETVAL